MLLRLCRRVPLDQAAATKPRISVLDRWAGAVVGLLAGAGLAVAQPVTLTVQTDHPGAALNRAMWGVFFEDINFGADGGLYAEMVKNRGFEFPDPMTGWIKLCPSKARGTLAIRDDQPFSAANPHYLRLESAGKDLFGVANEGFRGMGVKQGEAYNFSAEIRNVAGTASLRVELYASDGALLDSVRLSHLPAAWEKRATVLHPNATDPKAKLYVLLDGSGTVDLDFVSLFPEKTWKNRPGGLRADMVQALADMHPGFVRFPGGCIVEGSELDKRYQWKRTLGPVEERILLIDRWNYEFLHRPTPDYFQSFGLGFLEFFEMCEDLGAQPLPILNCGMACQFNSGELCSLDDLQPYIQDALDLVEFANGATNTVWGAKRAALGHPEPFNLRLLGVGNEQWGQQYIDRYAKFAAALKEKYPDVKLVAAAGPEPADSRFSFAWTKLRELSADIIDEHCYATPDWFFNNTHRYDNYDRTGPKVFMGEYAAQSDKTVSVKNRNDLGCALAEAAYMTGLERNGDEVRMASYAPLFANTEAWQWTPDLIWVNTLGICRTPNYHVQALFASNPGDVILPLQATAPAGVKFFASATRDNASGETILKVVNAEGQPMAAKLELAGAKSVASEAAVTTLAGSDLKAENTFADPDRISPQASHQAVGGTRFTHTFPANSFTVLRIKAD